ncbi:5-oxoprolinase/urea amidolyase family protein [Mycolicibacterium komossense]|uniref:5-oxoprolinase/urea amidolyase family protein n=1 Tax=Mycolicibacterium komossense TaxID=1779 RepID=A0ABT3C6B6_9MYCO|nr:5-oxoprolinase/urea amidolyase family protein [Mycolicibacterium komossense]MCV7225003.1 5-oxoprolinase/urea amidolyase family protein [Mycolicibacterium komossense]
MSALIEVVSSGMLTTVQDWPGRIGYWHIGVPPSGPMDDLSFRLGNRVLGNAEGAPGLECTRGGPTLRFPHGGRVCVTGAPVSIALDGVTVPQWQSITIPADATLEVGRLTGPGMRCYVLIAGGLSELEYLGSTATFTMGSFGGHDGRALRAGDTLCVGADPGRHEKRPDRDARAAIEDQPSIGHRWEVAVTEGPHGAPEFFTRADMDTLIRTDYTVHFNSDRTGVRLEGPKPQWARTDGGEAGLHPSNIHDNAYCVGALDFTGDTPILLGPDGPSLGGFVCPVTVVGGDRWKLGQMAPGDAVRFVAVRADRAPSLRTLDVGRRASFPLVISTSSDSDDGVLGRYSAKDGTDVTLRRSGDGGVLVEYGPMALDLAMRARVHVLDQRLRARAVPGLTELTPGVRSLQVQFDPTIVTMSEVRDVLAELDEGLPANDELVVPSRAVSLPLSWDDPATREAIQRYMHGVRSDAPWCPWNIEFIRRINGLDDVSQVHDIVYDAEYLVLGLGDVYLGAPVATPLDPRHRLVTTKYNPARTWTPENAVGIGGAYLCVYGMEGPGGYQFVGRTTQVWNHRHPLDSRAFEPGTPWLLRYFDRISFYPVGADELMDLRADMAAGRGDVAIAEGTFSMKDYLTFLAKEADPIATFRRQQAVAFAEERQAWGRAGEFTSQLAS